MFYWTVLKQWPKSKGFHSAPSPQRVSSSFEMGTTNSACGLVLCTSAHVDVDLLFPLALAQLPLRATEQNNTAGEQGHHAPMPLRRPPRPRSRLHSGSYVACHLGPLPRYKYPRTPPTRIDPHLKPCPEKTAQSPSQGSLRLSRPSNCFVLHCCDGTIEKVAGFASHEPATWARPLEKRST